MNTKETTRARVSMGYPRPISEYEWIQIHADVTQLSSRRTTTARVYAVCGWSLIEAPLVEDLNNRVFLSAVRRAGVVRRRWEFN